MKLTLLSILLLSAFSLAFFPPRPQHGICPGSVSPRTCARLQRLPGCRCIVLPAKKGKRCVTLLGLCT